LSLFIFLKFRESRAVSEGADGFFDRDFLFGNPAVRVFVVERAARDRCVKPEQRIERRNGESDPKARTAPVSSKVGKRKFL
jgi:hypothetical protein